MGRKNRKAVGLALAVLLIALSCACRYSLVSFQSLEEGVAYYQRGAEIERVIEGDDTILVAYKFLGGHGFIVFSEITDSVFRKVERWPRSAKITQDCSIYIYEFSFSDDKYIRIELVNRDSKYSALEISNDYDWQFERLGMREPMILVSAAGCSAEPGKYAITINGDIVKFELGVS